MFQQHHYCSENFDHQIFGGTPVSSEKKKCVQVLGIPTPLAHRLKNYQIFDYQIERG